MNDPVRLIEPLGERAASLPLDLGGTDAAVVLPGAEGMVARVVRGEKIGTTVR